MGKYLSFIALAFALWIARVHAQDELTFRDVLSKSLEERTKIKSFECSYKIRKISNVSSNSEGLRLKIDIASEGKIKFDELTCILYSENSDTLNSIEGTPAEEVDRTRRNFRNGLSFRLIDGNSDYVSEANAQVISSRERFRDIGKIDLPFPIFDVSLALPGDQFRSKSLVEVTEDLVKLYGEKKLMVDSDGLVWCDFSTNQFIIDTSKDYWPIRRILWGNRKLPNGKKENFEQYRSDIHLTKIEEYWMPSLIEIRTPNESKKFELEWSSINKTIDPADLHPEKLAERKKRELIKQTRW